MQSLSSAVVSPTFEAGEPTVAQPLSSAVVSPTISSEHQSGISPESTQKLAFLSAALDQGWPDTTEELLNDDVRQCLLWVASRSEDQIIADRESFICRIEQRGNHLLTSGAVEKWFVGSDEYVRAVSRTVNGPLLEELAHGVNFHDSACIEHFRVGAPLYGVLAQTGNGVAFDASTCETEDQLKGSCSKRNRKLLRKMRVDPNAAELVAQTKVDASVGRMTEPLPLSSINIDEVAIASRFSVEQGVRSDGSRKIRAVDDESAAGINPACAASERLKLDGLDKLIALVRHFVVVSGCVPELFKADIDAAFRLGHSLRRVALTVSAVLRSW